MRPGIIVNETYFSNITSEEQAYWLGFIAADGNINDSSSKTALRLRVMLSQRDGSHVEKLKAAIGYSGDVRYHDSRSGTTITHKASIDIASHQMASDLIACGVTPRKSFTLQPWDGPLYLMRHYWRGLFDGNGSLFTSKNGNWSAHYCGSEFIVKAFQNYMMAQGIKGIKGGKGGALRHDRDTPDLWRVEYGGRKTPQAVVRVMYDRATVYLDRKMEIAQSWLAIDTLTTSNPVTGNLTLDDVKHLCKIHGGVELAARVLGINSGTLRAFCLKRGYNPSEMAA